MQHLFKLGWVAATLWLSAATAHGQDVIRLGGVSASSSAIDAQTQTLGFNGDVNTELTRWGWGWGRGWGGWGGYGYRGWYGGLYRGYGFYGPRFYYGYYPYYRYRPYYYGYGYYPYTFYRPYYYYPYSYGATYYFSPCSANGNGNGTSAGYPQTVVLGSSVATYPTQQAPKLVMPPIPDSESSNGQQTFPYDGGPAQPVPLPGVKPAPMLDQKRPALPLEGRLVSLPAVKSSPAFPAYGETMKLPGTRATYPTSVFVSAPAAQSLRIHYPAYGEK